MKLIRKAISFFFMNGELTGLGVFTAVTLGIFSTYFSVEFLPFKGLKILGLCIGVVFVGIGGYSARAKALGLPPPFTSDPLGWRKAKESYKTKEETEEKRANKK